MPDNSDRLSVSVVICTRNGEQRLPETLAKLEKQEISEEIPWEVVVIDNASSDASSRVAKEHWNRPGVPLRILKEPKPSQSLARLRGLLESRSDLVSFVDDDNWVASDWVNSVSNIMRDHLWAGACGGQSIASIDGAPPVWFEENARNYAVGKQGPEAGEAMLWGAGLTIRRSAFKDIYRGGFHPRSIHRKNREGGIFSRFGLINPLRDGGDTELCTALRCAGWRLRYEPQLRLVHHLDESRLRWSELRKLNRGFGWASVGLDTYKVAHELRRGFAGRWRARWWAQLPLCSIKLAKALAVAAPAMLQQREGATSMLRMEYSLGRFFAFLYQRGNYDAAIRELEDAPWIRKGAAGR